MDGAARHAAHHADYLEPVSVLEEGAQFASEMEALRSGQTCAYLRVSPSVAQQQALSADRSMADLQRALKSRQRPYSRIARPVRLAVENLDRTDRQCFPRCASGLGLERVAKGKADRCDKNRDKPGTSHC
jgi:hypothetical protein